MVRTSLKSSALQTIELERTDWQALVEAAGDRLEESRVTAQWSFKDLMGHLLGWRDRSTAELEAAARREPVPPTPWPADLTTDDEINAWIDEKQRARTAADLLAGLDASHDRMTRLVESLSESEIEDPNRFPSLRGESLGDAIVGGSFYAHLHEEHEPDIQRWLQGHRPPPTA